MNLRRAAGVLFAVFVALGLLGCGSKPSPSTAGGKPAPVQTTPTPAGGTQPAAPAKLEDVPVDHAANLADYRAEYDKNAQQTREKYQDKWVELTGTVKAVDRMPIDGQVSLIDPKDESVISFCRVKDVRPWNAVLPGQAARVRGKVFAVGPALLLEGGVVMAAMGPPPPTATAAELAKLFTDDKKAFEKRLVFGQVVVTGEIKSAAHDGSGQSKVVLTSGADGGEVTCVFKSNSPAEKDENAKLAKGQTVKVLGKYDGSPTCTLTPCYVFAEKK